MSTKKEQSLGRNDGDEQMPFKHLREEEGEGAAPYSSDDDHRERAVR